MQWLPYNKGLGYGTMNKAPYWTGYDKYTPQQSQPYWAPTQGGGWAKQYPPGQAGIPYAWYPQYGVVQ